MPTMLTPKGYDGVEHDDGTIHAIDLSELSDNRPLWREIPICGLATGVSSDEYGPEAIHRPEVTCWECKAILS